MDTRIRTKHALVLIAALALSAGLVGSLQSPPAPDPCQETVESTVTALWWDAAAGLLVTQERVIADLDIMGTVCGGLDGRFVPSGAGGWLIPIPEAIHDLAQVTTYFPFEDGSCHGGRDVCAYAMPFDCPLYMRVAA